MVVILFKFLYFPFSCCFQPMFYLVQNNLICLEKRFITNFQTTKAKNIQLKNIALCLWIHRHTYLETYLIKADKMVGHLYLDLNIRKMKYLPAALR